MCVVGENGLRGASRSGRDPGLGRALIYALRAPARFLTGDDTGSDRKTTSPNTWSSSVCCASAAAKAESSQSTERIVLRRQPTGLLLGVGRHDGDLPAEWAAALLRRRRQPEQRTRLTYRDGLVREDYVADIVIGRQSAVLSRRIVNSIAPSGSSRQLSTLVM